MGVLEVQSPSWARFENQMTLHVSKFEKHHKFLLTLRFCPKKHPPSVKQTNPPLFSSSPSFTGHSLQQGTISIHSFLIPFKPLFPKPHYRSTSVVMALD